MKAAAVQLNSTADFGANLATADRLTRAAAADGARLIVLPEKWTAMGSVQELRACAEPLDGRAVSWARDTAAELRVDLVAGSFLERIPGEDKLANTCVHVSSSGGVRAVYRKLHMFDVTIDGRCYRESDVELPGDEIVLSETSTGRADASAEAGATGTAGATGVELGLAVCYDLRFPELFRVLAVRGARILALPSAFTLPTTRDHWEVLVRARAIENQAFVIAANQVGPHPGGARSGGRSMIVDPWGVVLAQAPDGEHHVVAELDLERQLEIRAQLPALAHRRPQAYGR
ncbi:MAG TPA: carbon-nitrogen hydrolase family protein [Solirubrobacteraceae bacterium]|jgi:predicted amidohydrolase|nr:carbon-nitrogen hydrolase family protein [Solirubrobacteraceae bacterium]